MSHFEEGCHFFNAGTVTESSVVGGVHLDAGQYAVLGRRLVKVIRPLFVAKPAEPNDVAR